MQAAVAVGCSASGWSAGSAGLLMLVVVLAVVCMPSTASK